nr:hypothetical protein CFP56_20720 [Quercus suber]
MATCFSSFVSASIISSLLHRRACRPRWCSGQSAFNSGGRESSGFGWRGLSSSGESRPHLPKPHRRSGTRAPSLPTQFKWRSPFLRPDPVEILSSSPRFGVDLAISAQIGWRSRVLRPDSVVISCSPSRSGGGRSFTTILSILSKTTRPGENPTRSDP